MATTFKALKAVRFGTKDYNAGDVIPAGVVLAKREHALVSMGIITKLDDVPDPTPVPAKSAETTAKASNAKAAAKK